MIYIGTFSPRILFSLKIIPNNIPKFSYADNPSYLLFPTYAIDAERFLLPLTQHTESGLTEHTKYFLSSRPNIPNVAKPKIPKLSFVADQTYRRFLTFVTEQTEQA